MEEFLYRNPVFTLKAIQDHFGGLGEKAAYSRLRRALEAGRVVKVFRGVFATVPPGIEAESFHPDPFLVLNALRPGAVFCGHSALDLHGVSNQVWNLVTAYSPRKAVTYKEQLVTYKTLKRKKWVTDDSVSVVDRAGTFLRVTNPELTLIEGFRYPGRVGGIEELVKSASAFHTLDLNRIKKLLERFGMRKLYAAAGWFFTREQGYRQVTQDYLQNLRVHRPASPQYLEKQSVGGVLDSEWNLIIPRELAREETSDIEI